MYGLCRCIIIIIKIKFHYCIDCRLWRKTSDRHVGELNGQIYSYTPHRWRLEPPNTHPQEHISKGLIRERGGDTDIVYSVHSIIFSTFYILVPSEASSDTGVPPVVPVNGTSVSAPPPSTITPADNNNVQGTAGVKRSSRSNTKREESKCVWRGGGREGVICFYVR